MVLVVTIRQKKYYLYGKGKYFYFSRVKKSSALDEIPNGYEVSENKSGLPFLRRKK